MPGLLLLTRSYKKKTTCEICTTRYFQVIAVFGWPECIKGNFPFTYVFVSSKIQLLRYRTLYLDFFPKVQRYTIRLSAGRGFSFNKEKRVLSTKELGN